MEWLVMLDAPAFDDEFTNLLRVDAPFAWQRRLFGCLAAGNLPAALDLPTGLGKTSVMAIWLIARAHGARLPRRLIYVVDRRAVVDQATTEAQKLRESLDRVPHLKAALGLGDRSLPISTLRGQFVDNREWLADPATPAIIVGTVDMIGSRLLFSGYGVSPKMRSYHAGLMGVDALVVLDEAHLVPPFEKLLEAIEAGADLFGPRTQEGGEVIPPFKLLSLSATGRERQGDVFRLIEEDLVDPLVKKRLEAKKRLTVESANSELHETLGQHAWALSGNGMNPVRILVYCDSRGTAEKTKKAIEELANSDIKKGVPKTYIDTELFVGARRVKQRLDASKKLKDLGFLAGSGVVIERPAFLIATSAGEVGIDLDADHMVCDFVPWERMVQRFGRVNRRGDGNARIIVIDEGEPKPKNADKPSPKESRDLIAYRALQVFHFVSPDGFEFDVSPGALRDLKLRSEGDLRLKTLIDAATTPAPLRPALTRPLVDAWSMTSLEKHTGRPDIAPWLRGWIEDDLPQTSVVWRKYLPVRAQSGEASKKEIEAFFAAAPPHVSEELETETWRVVEWLMDRAKWLTEKLGSEKTVTDGDAESSNLPLKKESIVALALAPDCKLHQLYRLRDLLKYDADKKRKEKLETEFSGVTLIVDAQLSGLTDGLLNNDEENPPPTTDSDEEWSREIGVRVRRATALETPAERTDWRFEDDFAIAKTTDGEVTEWLIIERLSALNNGEDGRAVSNPQSLARHESCVALKALGIAAALGLRADLARALEIAARLHDEGKKAPRWQRAFNARRDDVYAKTKGPINQALLDGYRHEVGSLLRIEDDPGFKNLLKGHQDLALHIVAAHHGGARPAISTRSCDDAPPSALEAQARDVALRFAWLQKIWGPWGLAWLESLLRAADQQASRENDARGELVEEATSEGVA
jgi:CRISPR-associated endonuclease/helicase Cas3